MDSVLLSQTGKKCRRAGKGTEKIKQIDGSKEEKQPNVTASLWGKTRLRLPRFKKRKYKEKLLKGKKWWAI